MRGEGEIVTALSPSLHSSPLTPHRTWFVYILRCADGTLYTGIALDIARRVVEHNTNNRLGASYTRGRRPVKLVYSETASSRSQAAKREHEIKSMTRVAKTAMLRATKVTNIRKVKA